MSIEVKNPWNQFLEIIRKKCSSTEYENWISPIHLVEESDQKIVLQVPNVFVREYLLDNYGKELSSLLPLNGDKEPAVEFIIQDAKKEIPKILKKPKNSGHPSLNRFYTFDNFIEGPSNQFVKSAALGVAHRPGKSFNPLFIHGGVGLGKTHLLHGIGHYVYDHFKKQSIQCITTEAFINDLVYNLRNKSIDKWKRFYRNLDVLLVDDIQFLQNRLNFEEEFCNTFESLIHQNKQIVITSDKPPSQLKLSERMIARMEWGLVAHMGIPELETRVAIVQHKAALKGIKINSSVAFFIAEHVYNNVRQLEGAINKLSAYCHLMHTDLTEEIAENLLKEMISYPQEKKITVDEILKSVATIFEVRVSDLKSENRQKEIAVPRQVAMYLAKELIHESLMKIASSFGGKTHSTLLHAWKKVSNAIQSDTVLRRQIDRVRKHLEN